MPRMGSLPGDSMQQRLCLLTINKNLQKSKLFYPNPPLSSKHIQRFLCFEMATERICSTNKDPDEKESTDKSINFECGRCFGSSSRLERFRFLWPRLSSCLEFEMFFLFFLLPSFSALFYCWSRAGLGQGSDPKTSPKCLMGRAEQRALAGRRRLCGPGLVSVMMHSLLLRGLAEENRLLSVKP